MSIGTVTRNAAHPLALLLLLAGLLVSQFAWSFQNRTYFVPLPDDDLLQSLRDIANSNTPRSPVTSTISLTVATGGTVIYWDQWEDGAYDPDVFNPTNVYSNSNTQGTQIWGDRNLANGCPLIKGGVPNPCAVPEDDFLSAGDVVFTRNLVPIQGGDGSYSREPDDDCTFQTGAILTDYCFDGRDKIGATFPLVVSRAGWANGSGSLLAGAVEVAATNGFVKAGDRVEAPVGPDTANSFNKFEYSALYIMAGDGGAQVTVTNTGGPGSDPLNLSLAQGESRLVPYNAEGAVAAVTSGDAQVHLITGDIGTNYESRWFAIPPVSTWSQAYITPVGTNPVGDCTALFAYNPADSGGNLALTVTQGSPALTSNFNAAPNSAGRSAEILTGNGARVEAASRFYALSVTDCDGGQLHDWGHPLVPISQLTTEVLTGWSPGCTTSNCGSSGTGSNDDSRSPIWVTPASGTGVKVYVDYDGEGAVCIGPNVVFGKVDTLTLDAGRAAEVTDDPPAVPQIGSQGDYDMTGARIFTCDGTKIAVAWGLDPALTGSSDNEALDMGNTVPPLGTALRCTVEADKTLVLAQGDKRVTYTFKLYNDGEVPLGQVGAADNITLENQFTSGTVTTVLPPSPPFCEAPAYVQGDTNGDQVLDQSEVWEYTCAVDVVPEAVSPPTTPATFIPIFNAAVAKSLNPTLESQACQWEVDVIDAELDFGDAPNSYKDPSHVVDTSVDLFLGAVSPDPDPGLQPTPGADGDDNDVTGTPPGNVGGDDEDGVTFRFNSASGDIAGVVTVRKNTANANARLCGWLDGASDGTVNGRFDSLEGECRTLTDNADSKEYNFVWFNLPDTVLSNTYARFRLTTGFLDTSDGGLGIAQDGEVEDYHIDFLPDDHGDAPMGSTVGTIPRDYGDASHTMPVGGPSVILGVKPPDAELSTQVAAPNATNALGDDRDGNDDEDGLFSVQALPGGIIQTRVVVVIPSGAGGMMLCGWIDGETGDVNGAFEVGEGQCKEIDGGGDAVLWDWTLPIGGIGPIDTYARFRVAPKSAGMGVGNPTGSFGDGEVEDYILRILPTRATIGDFRVGLVPVEGLDLTDPQTGEPLVDPDTGEPLEIPPEGAAQVQWETLSEQGTLGFYLERRDAEESGGWNRINGKLLPGLVDAPLGSEYRLFDLDVAAGERHSYRLVELEAWGTQLHHGPYDVIIGGDAGASARAAPAALDEGVARSRPDRRRTSGENAEHDFGQWHQLDRHFQGRKRLPPRLRENRQRPDGAERGRHQRRPGLNPTERRP